MTLKVDLLSFVNKLGGQGDSVFQATEPAKSLVKRFPSMTKPSEEGSWQMEPCDPVLSPSFATLSMNGRGEGNNQKSIAHSVEFVARPGVTEHVRDRVLVAVRQLLGRRPNFSGCLILVSEQEARLMTLITFWTGPDNTSPSVEDWKQLKKLLSPYVDRWLRTRNLAAFLCMRGQSATPAHSG